MSIIEDAKKLCESGQVEEMKNDVINLSEDCIGALE